MTNRAVRVMHVVYEFGVGGMEAGVAKLANHLDQRDVITSICSCRPLPSRRPHVDPSVSLFALDRRDGNDWRLVRSLASLFRREQPDIVHTHTWGTLIEGLLAARIAGTPVVIHGEHGTLETRRLNIWVQRYAWRRVDRVLAVSSILADRMAAQTGFPRDRIEVIRNGVDVARFTAIDREIARRKLGIAAEAFVIGTVGRLVPVKNQRALLSAAAELRAAGIASTVVLAGDGPLRSDLEQWADALGIAAHVMFLGARDDVPEVMAALDVFVLPSVSEGSSNTILEAMAAGVPIVATRVGGNEELVAEGVTGYLVPADSTRELVMSILSLQTDPDRARRMAAAGRMRVAEEFSLSTMVARYRDLYCDLAGQKLAA